MTLAARTTAAAVILLAAAGPVLAQGRELTFRAGLGAETLSRTVRWDDEKRESKLASLGAGLRLEMTYRSRLTLSLFGGLSFTDVDGLIFYHLPISLEYRTGIVRGIMVGAEVAARAMAWGAFELDGRARFLTSAGTRTAWPLEGFAVKGEARGKPNWTAVEAGPKIVYKGFRNAAPYLFAAVNWLWGDVRMEEALDTLKGDETKSIKGAGLIRTGAGATFAFGRRVSLWAEAGIVPRRGGADYDARIALLYSF
jgi:hypothetical protein